MNNKNKYRPGIHLARASSCLLFLICIAFIYVIMVSLRPAILPDAEYRAVNGILNLQGFHFDEPIEIIGQWQKTPLDCCEEMFCEDHFIDFEYLSNDSIMVDIPMPFTAVTNYASAYRLLLSIDDAISEIYIYLSTLQVEYKVIFNTNHIFGPGMESEANSLIPMLPVVAFRLEIDHDREYQELVIIVCYDYEGADFFHSEFVLGNSDQVRMYVLKRMATWALITGLFIMLLLNRLIFMMICPENKITSLMTIVDAAVMIRVLFGIPELYHVKLALLNFPMSNENIAQVSFLPVLIIGIVTIHFIERIFNVNNQVNKKWFPMITITSCIVGIVFFFNIHLMATNIGFAIYLIFFLPGSFLGGWVFVNYLRKNKLTGLQIFYVTLLAVTGFMIVYDMISIRNTSGNFLMLLFGYFTLIFLNLCSSLWDNYSKYKEYEKLSRDFEETVNTLRINNIDLQHATLEQHRLEKLLQTVNDAATVLLAVNDKKGFESALMWSMEMIGHCLDADRVQMWYSSEYEDGICVSLGSQWLSELGQQYPQIESTQKIPYGSLPKWEEMFYNGLYFNGPITTLPFQERQFLNEHNLKSVVIIPVVLQDQFWGFFSIDDCVNERMLSIEEMDILRSASLMIASTGHRVEQAAIMQHIEVVEESNRAKSRFLARMSHEIRTPITSVMGISEIHLQKHNLPLDVEESFSKIHNSANLLLGIINDILDLSKIESGKMTMIHEKYDVASMINDVAHLNLANLDNKNVKFHMCVDETLPCTLIGDVIRIEQILNNLLSNAFKYTEFGSVEFTVKCQFLEHYEVKEDYVMLIISICDTGMGMTAEQVDILYNEYTRFHESDAHLITGTGLGMPIVYSLAEMMDAHIELESEVGKGTNIVIHIPQKIVDTTILGKETALRLQQLETDELASAKKFKFTPEPMPYGRVLIVDDVEANLFVAQGLLSFYGLNIETCTSGFEAIEKIKQGEVYDIIFMDHMMPDMDGTEAMLTLRDMGYPKSIVALTANTMIGQEEVFIKNGFDGFISKPIQTKQLNAILIKHIKDKQPPEVIEAAAIAAKDTSPSTSQDIDNYQNKGDLVEKLRTDFAKNQKNIALDITQALNTGDTQTAHRLAHTLKGLAGLIKEDQLEQAAKDVENLLADGKMPENNHLREIEHELARVLESIGKPEIELFSNYKELDKDKAMALFDKLYPLLKSSNANCLSLLDELRTIPETAILIRQIEDFDFAIALKTLDTLRSILVDF
ncbi:MAG: response regulator [Defluviitaleaceae bacterium]|nr:response regulator [Defluviitaleaceae bacterium]